MNLLLADDHQLMRDGLKALCAREGDMRVVGEAGDGAAALQACRALCPDIVLMDVLLPGINGVEVTRQLFKCCPHSRVVALSVCADQPQVHAMFEAGAWGYLVKTATADELFRALRAVEHNAKYVSPAVAGALLEKINSAPPSSLREPHIEISPRERDVLQLLAQGLTSKEIAAQLSIAACTVETHRKTIMSKLNLHSVAALTKFAIRTGLTGIE